MKRSKTPSVLLTFFMLLPLLFSMPARAAENMDVVQSETGFYYTVKKGDTLWDLSKQFNDSPWLWPELWEENDQISNPHWIFPGERIRLYRKSGRQAVTTDLPAPPPPAAEAEPEPVSNGGPFFVYSSIDRVGFIRKPPVSASGTIFAVQDKKVLISEGDIVYIRPSADSTPNSFIPGSRYLVFRCLAPTDAQDSKERIGTQHLIVGLVEVVKRDPDLVTVNVLKSFRPINEGDLLMPYTVRDPKIPIKPSTPGIDGQVITSEDHTILTGDFMLAFIDKGSADNIEVGQQYSVYRKPLTDDKNGTGVELPPVDFGTLLVLHTEQNTSTAVVVNTTNNIDPGEHFRTPVN